MEQRTLAYAQQHGWEFTSMRFYDGHFAKTMFRHNRVEVGQFYAGGYGDGNAISQIDSPKTPIRDGELCGEPQRSTTPSKP